MNQIFENFYLGNYLDARNPKMLKKNNIQYIINCTKEIPNYHPKNFLYLHIPLNDPDPALLKYLETIEKNFNYLSENKIPTLIHCRMGISRSVTVLTYFLSKKLNCSWKDILKIIKQKRPIANPNLIFQMLLDEIFKT